ncbi:MAG TPA: lysophospholipid acyltransferase family protein [Burkholderiaceae bacterium]|nr:lysophospholipid acyltransferase family protein [Burkholderiaceae bacterium]
MLHRLWRLPVLVALLFGGLATVFLAFPLLAERGRERCIATWSRWLMRACGTRVRELVAPGAEPLSALRGRHGAGQGRLLLANHVSWLDIFAIDSLSPASFAAKAEIAGWPLAGTLVARAGTVFVERGRRHAVHGVIRQMGDRLAAGARAAVFPEGTTSDGQRLLPFHGNLVQAALNTGAPMVPVGLRYVDPDGTPSLAARFVGDTTFLESLWRVTGHPATVVEVHVMPAIVPGDGVTRQEAARRAREAIGARLGLGFDDTVPDTLRAARAGATTD